MPKPTTGLVLINIVVAVLLDEFISSVTAEKDAKHKALLAQKEQEAHASRQAGVLDPLTAAIATFYDNNDLSAKIKDSYHRLDENNSGGLDFEEFRTGVKKLPTSSPIYLMQDDFDLITEHGAFCNDHGEFLVRFSRAHPHDLHCLQLCVPDVPVV